MFTESFWEGWIDIKSLFQDQWKFIFSRLDHQLASVRVWWVIIDFFGSKTAQNWDETVQNSISKMNFFISLFVVSITMAVNVDPRFIMYRYTDFLSERYIQFVSSWEILHE